MKKYKVFYKDETEKDADKEEITLEAEDEDDAKETFLSIFMDMDVEVVNICEV